MAASSHGKRRQYYEALGGGCIVSDILEKNVSTNLDNNQSVYKGTTRRP